jgi:hypothetical protein
VGRTRTARSQGISVASPPARPPRRCSLRPRKQV